MNGIGKVV